MNNDSNQETLTTTDKQDYGFVDRLQIIWRCVFNRCPRCSHSGISKPFKFPESCPNCQFVLDRGNGFLLSALPAVYFMYTLFWLLPLVLLMFNQLMSFTVAMVLIGVGAVAIPVLFFNYCKMLALALYYFFMIHELYRPELQDDI